MIIFLLGVHPSLISLYSLSLSCSLKAPAEEPSSLLVWKWQMRVVRVKADRLTFQDCLLCGQSIALAPPFPNAVKFNLEKICYFKNEINLKSFYFFLCFLFSEKINLKYPPRLHLLWTVYLLSGLFLALYV